MKSAFVVGRSVAYGALRQMRNLFSATLLALGAFSSAQAQDDPIVIVAFGDSLMAGYGLDSDQGFVPQLQQWLDAQGAGAQVVNAGVSGDTTAMALGRLDWALADGADAVILGLGANDMLRGLPPSVARENLDQILGALAARDLPVLLAGMRAASNYGIDYVMEFNAIYADLSTEHSAMLYPFMFQGMGEADSLADLAPFMQADGMHPNPEGVALIVQDIGPHVLDLIAQAREKAGAGT